MCERFPGSEEAEEADAEQLGSVGADRGGSRDPDGLGKEQQEEEEEGGSDGRLKRHLVEVRKVEGKPESRLEIQIKWIRC